MAALTGVRVVHLARTIPTAVCSMFLADQGADVVRVDQPGFLEDRASKRRVGSFNTSLQETLDRNKRSIAVDLKADGGPEVLRRLAARADVFIDSLRPGNADRLGVGYESLHEINPRLVYGSLTGYGQDGPYAGLSGHALNYVALSGMLEFASIPGATPRVPNLPVADMAGAMQLMVGIMLAMVDRQHTGEGQRVDASMSDAMAMWMIKPLAMLISRDNQAYDQWVDRANSPYYNVYRCADGRFLSLACIEPWLWAKLCTVIGLSDLVERQHAVGPERRRAFAAVAERLATRNLDEWIPLLRRAGLPVAPVLTLEESFDDPHIVYRRSYVTGPSPSGPQRTVGDWVRLCSSPVTIRRRAPLPGEHTDEVLREAGYDAADVQGLRELGTVA